MALRVDKKPSIKKHPCPDCSFCQYCSSTRCSLCHQSGCGKTGGKTKAGVHKPLFRKY
ncbi:MAG: hypothetical protein AB1632_04530 [Nitrospirota bacterium]